MIDKNSSSSKSYFSIHSLFENMGMKSMLLRCGFKKRSGASPVNLLIAAISTVLCGYSNIYEMFCSTFSRSLNVSRDSVYRFLKNDRYNWNTLLLDMSAFVVKFISSLSDEGHFNTFIIDDTVLERPRSKKTEGLCWIFNHVIGKSVKGFIALSLGWSDGISFVPVSNHLVGARKDKNRIQGLNKSDRRLSSYERKAELYEKKPNLALRALKRALNHGINASHVLVDSWFFSDTFIASVKELGLDVICLVKTNLCFTPLGECKGLKQSKLFKLAARTDKSETPALIARTKGGAKVKLVFVTSYSNSSKILTLTSTDLSLSAEQIIRLYSRRWMIEVNYKAQKQWLGLGTESQAHNFTTFFSEITICSIRYMLLEFSRRCSNDARSLGELFRSTVNEAHEIPYREALKTLLLLLDELPSDLVKEGLVKPEQKYKVRDLLFNRLNAWLTGVVTYIRDFISNLEMFKMLKVKNTF